MKKILLALFILTLSISLAGIAHAEVNPALGTILVQVTSQGACTVTGNPINFGVDYDSSAEIQINDTTVDVNCTDGTVYAVSLDSGGAYDVGSDGKRGLMNGTDRLAYELYYDNNINAWGDDNTTHLGSSVSGNVAGATVDSHAVWATLFAGQNVPVGTYNDTITISVVW